MSYIRVGDLIDGQDVGYWCEQYVEQQNRATELRVSLRLVLDHIDYTSGAGKPTEMIGALLPKEILARAKAAVKGAMMVDFVATSKRIVAALTNTMSNMTEEDDRIRLVYNSAIDDAITFVKDMGVSNPDIRLACMRLEREMREWLPLRSEDK